MPRGGDGDNEPILSLYFFVCHLENYYSFTVECRPIMPHISMMYSESIVHYRCTDLVLLSAQWY